jgi:hypothetical protein
VLGQHGEVFRDVHGLAGVQQEPQRLLARGVAGEFLAGRGLEGLGAEGRADPVAGDFEVRREGRAVRRAADRGAGPNEAGPLQVRHQRVEHLGRGQSPTLRLGAEGRVLRFQRLAKVRQLHARLVGVRLVQRFHRGARPLAQRVPAGRVDDHVAGDDGSPVGDQLRHRLCDLRSAEAGLG